MVVEVADMEKLAYQIPEFARLMGGYVANQLEKPGDGRNPRTNPDGSRDKTNV